MTQAKSNKTFMKRKEDVERKWFHIDATGLTLGRLASEIAKILRGKHDPSYTPHTDCGDGVIVTNCEKVRVTGNKSVQKMYRHYTGFQSGLREMTYQDMLERKPNRIIEHAVKGMVPRTRLGRRQMKRLRVFAGPEHGMEAQQPIAVNSK